MGGRARAPAGAVHGFPRALTAFVGREAETARVVSLLGGCRLVTVTGPGGVGKTRLASEAARRAADGFADGAWLVELAPVTDPALVPAAVAAALGVQRAAGVPVSQSLADVLGRQQLLLVLDNCEHVLGAVADLCGSLLTSADDLTVLATSREPAGIAGETRYRLRPLPVTVPGASEGTADAAALFAERARLVDPDFVLDTAAKPLVMRLVARLDGMPLAIELAAARLEALGLAELLARLEGSFALLAGSERGFVPRHQSLAATVEWSYRLLDEQGQRVFRRLAAFPGPFTLDGAVAVAGVGAEPVVLHLVDCSLLSPPRADADGRNRYVMLETLRAYGTERLAEVREQPASAAALAGYTVRVAEEATAELSTSAGELAAVRRLDAEDPTMHLSLSWCLAHDPALALRLASALAPWWRIRGRAAAGYELLSAAAARAREGEQEWCAAQLWLGDLAAGTSDAVGLAHFTAARDALAPRPRSPLLVRALNGRTACLANLGRLSEAGGDARQALAMSREVGYPDGEANALYWLAGLSYYAGDQAATLEWLRQTQSIDPAAVPARTLRRCSLGLTIALTEAGDYPAARATCDQALAAARHAGDLLSQAECLAHLADIDLRTGLTGEARTRLGEALDLATRTGHKLMISDCLDYCGHLCAAGQRWDEAITLWAALAASQQRSGLPDPPLDAGRRLEPMRKAEQALGHGRARAARQRGTAMSLATAGEFAMLQTAAQPPEDRPAPSLPQLSARESELVTLVAQGQTDAQIAGQLFISISTVRSHLDRIRDKTGCRRRADLTRMALQAGFA